MAIQRTLVLAPLLAACTMQTGGAAPAAPASNAPASAPEAAPAAAPSAADGDWQSQPETDARRATYDGMTVIEKPGPDPRRRDGGQDVCDAAHNHCLHSNSWFLAGGRGPHDAVLVFRFDGRFYGWKDSDERTQRVAYRTEPATADALRAGAKVMVFHPMDSDEWAPPRSASQARDWQNWGLLEVATVDAAAGTFRTPSGKRDFPLAVTRVVVEEAPVTQ